MSPAFDRFVFAERLQLEAHHYNKDHLYGGAASDILVTARSAYLRAVGWPGLGPRFWLIVRHLAIDYVTEAFDHEELWCGVRTVSRSRRTVNLELCVWEHQTSRLVLDARIADVAFDVGARQSVDVPDDFWSCIERYEARSIAWE